MTEHQQQLRKNRITCSRLPRILGLNDFPIDVYSEMVYDNVVEQNAAMEAGLDHETAILNKFAREMDCKIAIPSDGKYSEIYHGAAIGSREATFVYPEKIKHPSTGEERTWFAGTPDALIKKDSTYLRELFGLDRSAVGATVQAKCVTSRKAQEWGESQFGEPPKAVIAQVMGEIIVARAELKTDINFGFVVALIGEPTQADYRFYCVKLDEETEQYLLQAGRDFWNIVMRRDVAQLSTKGNWKPFFEHEYPKATVESVRDEDGSFGVLWKELRRVKEDLAVLKSASDGLETAIRLKAKTAGLVYGDEELGKNGLLFTLKNDKGREEVDWEQVARAFVTKRNKSKFEKIVADHTKTISGSRRFLAKGMNGRSDE